MRFFAANAERIASLSARRAWIEIAVWAVEHVYQLVSLSARRAWIEIRIARRQSRVTSVALRKESVDRNVILLVVLLSSIVALRKESVDRNEWAVLNGIAHF